MKDVLADVDAYDGDAIEERARSSSHHWLSQLAKLRP
jgi:hypothetical protein